MNSETAVDLFVNTHPMCDVQVVSSPTADSSNLNQQIRNLLVTGDARTSILLNRQVRRMNSLVAFKFEYG